MAERERSADTSARQRERLERAEVASRDLLAQLNDANAAHNAIARQLELERREHELQLEELGASHRRATVDHANERAIAAATISQLEAKLADVLHETAEGARVGEAGCAHTACPPHAPHTP